MSSAFDHVVLLHHMTNGDSGLFLLVILGIVAATVYAVIRDRRSR